MHAIIRRGRSDVLWLFVSLALVFAGSMAMAEGLTALAPAGDPSASLLGTFSAGDLEQLEQATAAGSTNARLLALGVDRPRASKAKATSLPAAAASEASVEVDLFPHSGRLMPLLVAQPDDVRSTGGTPVTMRPGLVQPVGISPFFIQRATPDARAGR